MPRTLKKHIVWNEQIDDVDYEFDIYGVMSPLDPGVSHGPPENCYPPEGGDLLSWSVFHNDKYDKHAKLMHGKIEQDHDLFTEIEELMNQEDSD